MRAFRSRTHNIMSRKQGKYRFVISSICCLLSREHSAGKMLKGHERHVMDVSINTDALSYKSRVYCIFLYYPKMTNSTETKEKAVTINCICELTAIFSLVQFSSVQFSPVQSSPAQSSPVQSSPVQSSAVQSSPVQSSPV